MEPLWESHGRRLSEAGVRRGSDNSVVLTEDTDSFIIGDRVWVGGTKPGQIAYIGETQFAPGDWAGIVLDEPIGKNDGSVAGTRYFQCEPKRGIFSRLTRLTRYPLSSTSCFSPAESFGKSVSPSLNASTTSLASTTAARDLQIGQRVIVQSSQGSKTGILRYIGTTEFAAGDWCGVELDEPVGKNDGAVGDKRYFECRPKYGLFAPSSKVSRSPSNRRTTAVTQRPSGAALNASLRKAGSRESLASSVASRVTTTASTASRIQKPGLPHTSTPARKTTQELLKDRRLEIEILRKERDLERERVTKAASQADEAEKATANLKKEYDKFREEAEKAARETQNTLTQLLEEKNLLTTQLEEERRKCEDLLFRFEEESINKDVIQNENTEQSVANAVYENKIKGLEKQLSEERERVVQLERDSTKLFEAEEELAKLRLELQTSGGKTEYSDLQKRYGDVNKAKEEFEKLLEEKNKTVEKYETEINEANKKLQEKEQENLDKEESKLNLQKELEETTRQLQEKCTFIDELQIKFKAQAELLEREIEKLKETIKTVSEQSAFERTKFIEEQEKLLKEKDEIIKSKAVELKAEQQKLFTIQESVLEQLKAENTKQIEELSESFNIQLNLRDDQIEQVTKQLGEKVQDISNISAELNDSKNLCTTRENEIKNLISDLEESKVKLNSSYDHNLALNKEIDDLKNKYEEEIKLITEQKTKLENDVGRLTAELNNMKEQLNTLNECIKIKDLELSKMQGSKIEEMEELRRHFHEQMEAKNKCIQDVTADVTQKSSRLTALENELADLKSIIANKDEEIKHLSEKTSELRDALTLSEQTKTNLESELKMYETNVVELNEKYARAEEKVAELTSKKEKLETEIANVVSTSVDSSGKLVKYSEDLRQKEKELDESRDREFKLQKSITATEMKVSVLERDLSKVNSLVDEMRLENEEIKSQLVAEKEKVKDALDKFTQSEMTEQRISEKNKTLQDDLKQQSSELLELNNTLKEIQGKNTQLEKELAAVLEKYKNEKSKLEKQILDEGNDQTVLKDNIETLEKLNAQMKSDQQAMDASIKKIEESLHTKNQYAAELESVISSKDQEIKAITKSLEEITTEKEEIKNSFTDIKVKYNNALTELTLLKSSNANLESHMTVEIAKLKQELEDEKSTLDTALKESKAYEELAKQKYTEFKATIELKETEIKALTNSLATEKGVTDSTNLQLQTLQEFVEIKDKELTSSVNQIASLNESIKTLESNVSFLKDKLDIKVKLINELESKIIELRKSNDEKASYDVKEKQKELDDLIVRHAEELNLKEMIITKLQNIMEQQEKAVMDAIDKYNTSDELIRKYERDLSMKDQTICELKDLGETRQRALQDYEARQNNIDILLAQKADHIESRDKTIAELRNKEQKLQEKIENFEEQINFSSERTSLLEENLKRMEKENKQLTTSYNEIVEKLNIVNENLKNSTNKDTSNHKVTNDKTEESAKPILSRLDVDIEKLKEEYELAKGQIDFLNSVIVDMQRKNETLTCKIEVLEMGIPSQEADDYNLKMIQKKNLPPRMFCDICDQFDLHETEDCPKQAQDAEPVQPIKMDKKKVLVERPYCENCEMFGHDTSACEDTETF
ncbi:CAP-Gly domain-containing linker protein 2 isoform X2 [Phymastichus coffea]|uniref:CAP-Gly domain-containing linker protein 2 isoform X2 n=1 Tax=Phymastichus coffea TaxID=108790 RepID=UPI00273C1C58|nr:CAP-Gly domain-containing linker protein 2 isoform X2 [Phymastichus coffea]